MNLDEIVRTVVNNPKVLETHARAREICSYGFVINCPACGERQLSNFDKLFVFVNDVCVMHFTDEECEVRAAQIFGIVSCI
jgi:hypothetical protein